MGIKIFTNISKEFKETTLTITAPVLTEEIQGIIEYASNSKVPSKIMANKNNEIYFIKIEDIICFFSQDKYNYIRTKDGIYRLKYKLYEIEEVFNSKDFIRISKSCIININQVKCFDTNTLGTLVVKLNDNTQEIVSKRNVSQIMKLLRERSKIIWKNILRVL